MIDEADLPIINAHLDVASETELHVSFSTIFKIPDGFASHMDAFNLSMYNADSDSADSFYPYTAVPVPAHALKGATTIAINATAPVLNATELSKWLNTTFYAPSSQVSFRGHTTIRIGALHFPVSIRKTIPVNGLNKLAGLHLDSIQRSGSVLNGTLTLPNPSQVAIGLGTLVFNASLVGSTAVVGNITLANAMLAPGNNTLPFQGLLDVDDEEEILDAAGPDGTVEMALRGHLCLVDGEDITYVESVLDSALMYISVPVG